jgi:hypothetical protein
VLKHFTDVASFLAPAVKKGRRGLREYWSDEGLETPTLRNFFPFQYRGFPTVAVGGATRSRELILHHP